MPNPPDLSDWDPVQSALSRTHSRERRIRAAKDLHYAAETAIREHDYQHETLMEDGELAFPQDSLRYGAKLLRVRDHLVGEIEKLRRKLASRKCRAENVLR